MAKAIDAWIPTDGAWTMTPPRKPLFETANTNRPAADSDCGGRHLRHAGRARSVAHTDVPQPRGHPHHGCRGRRSLALTGALGRTHRVVIVVAGMDGALVSVLGGLIGAPLIAVPTSTDYRAARWRNRPRRRPCVLRAGVLACNIDNGYGAACACSHPRIGSDMTAPIDDLLVIGGGVNGCGIARDAAGRGLSVHLAEKSDLAAGTSSASTKTDSWRAALPEHYAFAMVREALSEREVLWSMAPHIAWPLRFVLPHHSGLRPAWLIRLGLFLYDPWRSAKPPWRTPSETRPQYRRRRPVGPLHHRFRIFGLLGGRRSLVVLNARDAAGEGPIHVRREVIAAGARRISGG